MSHFLDELEQLPLSDRAQALDDFIYGHFRQALMLEPHETVDFKESFFDLGMTSLTLTESKRVFEQALRCVIDTPLLFNNPTVPTLIKMLKQDVLQELFESSHDKDFRSKTVDYSDINHLINKKFNL